MVENLLRDQLSNLIQRQGKGHNHIRQYQLIQDDRRRLPHIIPHLANIRIQTLHHSLSYPWQPILQYLRLLPRHEHTKLHDTSPTFHRLGIEYVHRERRHEQGWITRGDVKHSKTSLGRVIGETGREVKQTAEQFHGVHKGLPSGKAFGADLDRES